MPTYGWTYSNFSISMEPVHQALKVHPDNPRYFDNETGKAIVLCGVNHGWDLQGDGWSKQFTLFWKTYLDYLESYNLNYIRLWKIEYTIDREPTDYLTSPIPYLRTGAGLAIDGQNKFDLDQFYQAYFDRMRKRCMDADKRGMYVCV